MRAALSSAVQSPVVTSPVVKLGLFGALLVALVLGGAAVGAAIGPDGHPNPGHSPATTTTVTGHDHG
ncbi:MAG TPA: hypothetical protein PLV68_13825 [Ilumatobacteraceae bacterium]|nr:hypothetical protein [Ilumatobacteraceae bacterium]